MRVSLQSPIHNTSVLPIPVASPPKPMSTMSPSSRIKTLSGFASPRHIPYHVDSQWASFICHIHFDNSKLSIRFLSRTDSAPGMYPLTTASIYSSSFVTKPINRYDKGMRSLPQIPYFTSEVCFVTSSVYCLHAENLAVDSDFENLPVELFEPHNCVVGNCKNLRKRVRNER